MKTPAEVIAALTMQDGMIENLDAGDAKVIIGALRGAGYEIVPRWLLESAIANLQATERGYDRAVAEGLEMFAGPRKKTLPPRSFLIVVRLASAVRSAIRWLRRARTSIAAP